MYNELFGKHWSWTQRQWRNVGIVFWKDTTGVDRNYAREALMEGGNKLGYLMLFAIILHFKRAILDGNNSITVGLMPELLYDEIMERAVKFVRSCEDGELKQSIIDQPYTHIVNIIKVWFKQILFKTKITGRYTWRRLHWEENEDLFDHGDLIVVSDEHVFEDINEIIDRIYLWQ